MRFKLNSKANAKSSKTYSDYNDPKGYGQDYHKDYADKDCGNHTIDCDRDFDKMLPEYIRLAQAYTPYQRYNRQCLFNPAEGFAKGTIFRGLYRPYSK